VTTKPLDEHTHNTQQHRHEIAKGNKRATIVQWRCPNCGQHIFVVRGLEPPDLCEYCKDMTTWELVEK